MEWLLPFQKPSTAQELCGGLSKFGQVLLLQGDFGSMRTDFSQWALPTFSVIFIEENSFIYLKSRQPQDFASCRIEGRSKSQSHLTMSEGETGVIPKTWPLDPLKCDKHTINNKLLQWGLARNLSSPSLFLSKGEMFGIPFSKAAMSFTISVPSFQLCDFRQYWQVFLKPGVRSFQPFPYRTIKIWEKSDILWFPSGDVPKSNQIF